MRQSGLAEKNHADRGPAQKCHIASVLVIILHGMVQNGKEFTIFEIWKRRR